MNILELIKKLPDQEACVKHLEKVKWGDKPTCPYCGSVTTYPRTKDLRHNCRDCGSAFSVTIGTIFHNSHIDLQKWFILMALMMNAKKSLSACQASRDLGLRRPTVWSMMYRIRQAMNNNQMGLLSGIVEMDETYVGGKPRKEIKKDDNDDDITPNKRGRGTKKECVAGMVERDGNVKAFHMDKKKLKGIDLQELVRKNVDTNSSVLMTDEYKAYSRMKNIIAHLQINHQQAYVNGEIHTNTTESFWALLKRGIIGQFHKVSAKYLYKYIDEFCFRYNQRKNECAFDFLVSKCI